MLTFEDNLNRYFELYSRYADSAGEFEKSANKKSPNKKAYSYGGKVFYRGVLHPGKADDILMCNYTRGVLRRKATPKASFEYLFYGDELIKTTAAYDDSCDWQEYYVHSDSENIAIGYSKGEILDITVQKKLDENTVAIEYAHFCAPDWVTAKLEWNVYENQKLKKIYYIDEIDSRSEQSIDVRTINGEAYCSCNGLLIRIYEINLFHDSNGKITEYTLTEHENFQRITDNKHYKIPENKLWVFNS